MGELNFYFCDIPQDTKPASKMKFALVLLPFAMSATMDEKRFLESLLGGLDAFDLAKQVLCQFGTDETEAQCESTMCPSIVDKTTHNALTQSLLCVAFCKEALVLIKANGGSDGSLHCPTTA